MIGGDGARAFELIIQADEHLKPEQALTQLTKNWTELNQDLALPSGLSLRVAEHRVKGKLYRRLIVAGALDAPLTVRPWMPGARLVRVRTMDADGEWTEKSHKRTYDAVSVRSFPESSFLISEAHSQGAPFIHGVGVTLKPLMTLDEEEATDPINGLRGPELYRAGAWNQATGWGDLTLGGALP